MATVPPTLDDVDLLDHDRFVEQEPWEMFELLQRGFDRRTRVLDPMDPGADLPRGATRLVEIASNHHERIDLAIDLADAVRQRLQRGAQRLRLGFDRRDGVAA